MADIQLDTQTAPSTPGANTGIMYVDSTSKELVQADDTAKFKTVRTLTNANTGDISANAADTYLVGLTVPPAKVRVGSIFTFTFGATKTNAGVATPIWTVRVGTAGTTADTARLTLTGAAQQANTDTGWAQIQVIVRSIGATGVIEGIYALTCNNAGFATNRTDAQTATSAGFDTTVANLIFGVSVNPGAAGNWTVTHASVTGVSL